MMWTVYKRLEQSKFQADQVEVTSLKSHGPIAALYMHAKTCRWNYQAGRMICGRDPQHGILKIFGLTRILHQHISRNISLELLDIYLITSHPARSFDISSGQKP